MPDTQIRRAPREHIPAMARSVPDMIRMNWTAHP
ncbi:hypothetical protein GGQ68_003350 [Sagittula marina]|uniref:Uncharacterized protein n=1 Tax=Sagittula marina TaxID=943940 RepID=A0A7W6DPS3_9RHOB|nr:hypothetical protein [Sagittula marina]